MVRLLTYSRIFILLVVLTAAPCLTFGQAKDRNVRLCDSLKNIIDKDTNNTSLANHYYELAHRYILVPDFNNAIEAARSAAFNYKIIGNMDRELECYLFMADNNILLTKSVETIKNYLSARKVLDRMRLNETNPEKIRKYREMDADLVTKIGLIYQSHDHFDRAIDNLNEALTEYNELGNKDKALDVKEKLASCYYNKKDYDNSLNYYLELRDNRIQNRDWDNAKNTYQRISDIYLAKHDYQKLYNNNLAFYDSVCRRDNIKEQLNALNNLAFASVCVKNYDEALKYYERLKNSDPQYFTNERESQYLLANTYNNIGLCQYNLGYSEDAYSSLSKAIDLHEKYSNYEEASRAASLLAHIYFIDGDYHNADHFQNIAVRNAELSHNRSVMEDAYKQYNDILRGKNEYEKALEYYQKYLNLQEEDKHDNEISQRERASELKNFSDSEKKFNEGLVDEEIKYLNDQKKIAEEKQRKQQEEFFRRQAEENQARADLEKDRADALQRLLDAEQLAKLEREEKERVQKLQDSLAHEYEEQQRKAEDEKRGFEQRQKDQEHALEIQKNQTKFTRLALVFAGVIILFFAGFIISMRKKNKQLKAQQAEIELKNADLIMKNEEITVQKENLQAANNEILTKNEELSRQKEVIEMANKSITDSIVYAKRIQTAVSPSPNFLNMFNFEYFLFFRPRDIVSGDYYWFHADDNNHIFICAADCTGHGVPGAFMSMLGLSLFNKIVAERNIVEVDEILNHLRTEVKAALHQEDVNAKQKDGMDLSLVRYDVDTKMLHFAAANNNGYLVQHFGKDEEERAKANLLKPEHLRETEDGYLRLTIMPADSMPIGVYIREKDSFTKTSYQLKEGDSFYLTSDGYIDQFGGKWGRKFLTKNFQKLVMDINEFDMKRQEKIVVDTHEEWIGDQYEQLDDIIVIGIRV